MPSGFPSNATIKAVYFDAAGTLIKPARRVGESYAAIAEKYGKTVTPSDLFTRFRVCFDGAPRLAFPNAGDDQIDRLERDWWRNLVANIFEPFGRFDNFDDYFAELFAYFAEPDAWALFPEVLDTLEALKQRGITLAVISNFDSRLVRILDGLGLRPWFADVFVSSRVGYAKPDRRIFDVALSRHGLLAEAAIHVGDSEANDLHGARNAGLKALLIDRKPASTASNDRLVSLRQIVAHLDAP
ncbi:MAG TPA: HAD-IA family hydrolase [Candidatus Limnocylindrales bacterium]|nr:HAD-IA family hydrolase [Candidatus Limnocylindrales bacterium]